MIRNGNLLFYYGLLTKKYIFDPSCIFQNRKFYDGSIFVIYWFIGLWKI